VTPDHGEITLDGKPVHFRSPQDGRNAGIETVYQNLALSPALSIADNMFLGREIKMAGPLGRASAWWTAPPWPNLPARSCLNLA
jgi:fructose transport system ATP-binding protein